MPVGLTFLGGSKLCCVPHQPMCGQPEQCVSTY